jgi:ribosomal protein L19E
MAVKNRGVLAAIKLGHTRIFINIKKIHDIKRALSMSDSEHLRADGDIWSLEGTTRKIHM